MSHEEYQELLALHALSALDVEEASAVEQHLRTCAECRAELNEWREASGLLAHAATPIEPRASLRADLLAQARSEGRANGKAVTQQAEVLPFRQPARRSPWPAVLRIAAAVVFVALSLSIILTLQHQIASLTAELEVQRQQLAQSRAMQEVVMSPDARTTALAGMPAAQNASGSLIYDRKSGRAVLMTHSLPPTPSDKAYELWFIANGRPMPGGTFTVDSSGRVMKMDQVPPEALEGAVFAITLEPAPGVDKPTGAMYLKSGT